LTTPRMFKLGDKIHLNMSLDQKASSAYTRFSPGVLYEVVESEYGHDCYDFKNQSHQGWDLAFINDFFILGVETWNDIIGDVINDTF